MLDGEGNRYEVDMYISKPPENSQNQKTIEAFFQKEVLSQTVQLIYKQMEERTEEIVNLEEPPAPDTMKLWKNGLMIQGK